MRPDFRLTETNAASIMSLCRWLEGLPLALEMAAEWAAVLTPAQMLLRMERRLDLVSRIRIMNPRHGTLRATVEGSYGALSSDLQQFLARLSVLQGAWPLDAAEAICPEARTLHYLAELRERSLVQVNEVGNEIQFCVLEMVRERAAENLSSEEGASLAAQYAQYTACRENEKPLQAVVLSTISSPCFARVKL